jgi:hypothetical protein
VANAERGRTAKDAIRYFVPVQSIVEIGNYDDFLIRRNSRTRAMTINELTSTKSPTTHVGTHMLHVLGVICHFNSIEPISQQLETIVVGARA